MRKYLNKINSPADIKKLSLTELKELCAEVRECMIRVVAANGGHLSSSLGVVELTIALHYVFNCPADKFIWDVGHQSYAHKILTERKDAFDTLRQFGGLSGFPKIQESRYDAFGTGHSSTSVSAALGLALARDLQQEKHQVVAVIGDGALTGGMVYEALNHAGGLKKNLMVILNDNNMSIDHNVGSMSGYLGRLRSDPNYRWLQEEVDGLLRRIPGVGDTVANSADRLRNAFKYYMVPGIIFEELGFTYLGPVDGHRLFPLVTMLRQARKVKGPVLLHVLTMKGKGYVYAEENPSYFHGVGPFDLNNGEPSRAEKKVKESSCIQDNNGDGDGHTGDNGGRARQNTDKSSEIKVPSYTTVFGQALLELARQDERIVAITAAMAGGTGLDLFARELPERFFDVGIAEQHALTLAAGMAAGGQRPVAAIYSTFMQRAYDQIIHDLAIQKLPVVLALDRAGIVGQDGETHQGVFDLSFLRHIPNMAVMAPKDENELRQMLKTALDYDEGPVALRYPRSAGEGVETGALGALPWGKAEQLTAGGDILLLAAGSMVYPALKAARLLKEREGIAATVINARFIKPLDAGAILSHGKRCGKMITIEENLLAGGFGSACLEMLERNNMYIPVKRLGIGDSFVKHGPREQLLRLHGLCEESIFQAAYVLCSAGAVSAS